MAAIETFFGLKFNHEAYPNEIFTFKATYGTAEVGEDVLIRVMRYGTFWDVNVEINTSCAEDGSSMQIKYVRGKSQLFAHEKRAVLCNLLMFAFTATEDHLPSEIVETVWGDAAEADRAAAFSLRNEPKEYEV